MKRVYLPLMALAFLVSPGLAEAQESRERTKKKLMEAVEKAVDFVLELGERGKKLLERLFMREKRESQRPPRIERRESRPLPPRAVPRGIDRPRPAPAVSYDKATALAFLTAASEHAGPGARLVRITISGLREDGTVDLTKSLMKGGGFLQYQFLVGDKGKLVNYLGQDHRPMIGIQDWDLTGAKAIGADDVKKLKDTPDLAKKAKDAGVALGKQDSSVSYYIRVDKPEARFSGGGKAAGFNATTGEKVR